MSPRWLKALHIRISALPRRLHALTVLVAGVGIGYLDYITGPDFSIILFYVLVVAWCGWWLGGKSSLALATVMGIVWAWVNTVAFRPDRMFLLPVEVWNALMVLGVFVACAFAMARMRRAYDAQQALNARLQTALSEIQVLEGLVPICAWCKSIRTENGSWMTIESFISKETPVQLTHSICPNCSNKVSP